MKYCYQMLLVVYGQDTVSFSIFKIYAQVVPTHGFVNTLTANVSDEDNIKKLQDLLVKDNWHSMVMLSKDIGVSIGIVCNKGLLDNSRPLTPIVARHF
ncbi:hypothetical protein TNIN_265391 [Trichonephila inaurata madagascariensis]|uniref:Uncharacterized protein n=1 Tax=Trichonephila inaurata madagascariensis TaxID=2747483 RepID=A0A8X6YWN4_9ARAC|nr:hypothetical protein TNIN_265391 [Trichonephila inaurata madagascariensis]